MDAFLVTERSRLQQICNTSDIKKLIVIMGATLGEISN